MAFNPIFHHLSLSSIVRSSTIDTLLSGTGSIAAAGSPNHKFSYEQKESYLHMHKQIERRNLVTEMNIE